MSEGKQPKRMSIPEEASGVEIAFLPPMSGVSSTETRLDSGAINVRLGDGRTAEVLRNLCYALSSKKDEKGNASAWTKLVSHMHDLFTSPWCKS
jgi:hypothetical protein